MAGLRFLDLRNVQARCWMAQDFPLSLQQLLPILDVVGYANKYLQKVIAAMTS